MTSFAIGGYFAWEQGVGSGLDWLCGAKSFQSARCAIVAVLRIAKPARIWVPNYICGAVNDALAASGVEVQRYPLSSEWALPPDVELESSDWLLCVDYFGICGPQIEAALDRYGPRRVVVDASQSLFHRIRAGETAIYSPRKFVAIPDGGLVCTDSSLPAPSEANENDSVARCAHLHSRAEGRVEEGYLQFQKAEASLENCEPVAMSRLTASLLNSQDAEAIAARRIENYRFLATSLTQRGFVVPQLPNAAVPLCCPVIGVDAERLRRALVKRCIFTPRYWSDTAIPIDDAIAVGLRDHALFLPCDQRYTPKDLISVVGALDDVSQGVPRSAPLHDILPVGQG